MTNQNLTRRFPELAEAILELNEKIEKVSRPAEEIILDDVDLRAMMKVSKRTTATWRQKQLIRYSQVQGKIYYILADVLDAIKRNAVNPIANTLKIKL